MTLPTLWSLVTLPTSLGRVASDYFVLFSWPCSHENKARQISLFVVACDPTYFWGRVASDYFLALPTPPLVAWPYLLSDRLWPYRQFVTLAMGFAWQVQQFRCLRDVVPWPYTCLLGRVASDRHWLFVAGAIFSMPPRSSLWPYFLFVWQVQYFRVLRELSSSWSYVLFVWQVQYFRCLREIPSWPGPMIACDPTSFLRGRCNLFDASEKFSVTLRKVACDPSSFLCGRCKCLATMVTLLPFCAAGAIFSMPPRSSSFVWQGQYFRCLREVPRDPFLSTMWFCHFETLPPPQSPP